MGSIFTYLSSSFWLFFCIVLPYDPGYVLRLCKEVDHLKGVLYILQLLDMHQEALQLAIELVRFYEIIIIIITLIFIIVVQ